MGVYSDMRRCRAAGKNAKIAPPLSAPEITMSHRLFIAKRPGFATAAPLFAKLREQLHLPVLTGLDTLAVYDVHDCPPDLLPLAVSRVFSDPVGDESVDGLPSCDFALVVEPLPGQFDQRADSAEQCLRLLDGRFADTRVTSAVAYCFHGDLDAAAREALRAYLINPIEAREKDLAQTALPAHQPAPPVPRHQGFTALDEAGLAAFHRAQGLAMTLADLALVQRYFQGEGRDPSETEIRVLDTYWSDHCRHTTFATELRDITFPDSAFGQALAADFRHYQDKRRAVFGDKADSRALTLMDLATIDARYRRQTGELADVEFSAEVNACSVFIDVDDSTVADGKPQKWLLQFKNETHNHPTEIEPFGGAATCIGGAIRDPLSGRAYVYQAMRLSGAADPREDIADTLPGKLPQIAIAQGSAAGASSYGDQIGLATGQIVEVYHPGYKAKHMEVGAVVAACPAAQVKREEPAPGDVVLLIGGATGRDGCGGATGSSREQHGDSLTESAAEVQKGNAPEERKLQRLFRNADFSRRVKRCNDFGAGGVAVAIGELADGLDIDLDAVPVKYLGLSGTELAISESQERMAVVIDAADAAHMIALAAAENLSATPVATVTGDATLTMRWQGDTIVSLKRAFLDSNGAPSVQESVAIAEPQGASPLQTPAVTSWKAALEAQLATLPFASQRGLGDRFDHSVGAACVLLPYGGLTLRTPAEASVYALPTEGDTSIASILAYGFHPDIGAWSPYHGGLYAVVDALSRLVACGGDAGQAYFSLQEYFRRLGSDATNWGLPYAALLGAHHALNALSRAAIGGKDSMSGTFHDLHVPPTLIAFAVAAVNRHQVTSPEFKAAGHHLYWLRCPRDAQDRPDFAVFAANNAFVHQHIVSGAIASARAIRHGGVLQAIHEASLGNRIGVDIAALPDAFLPEYGGYLLASAEKLPEQAHLHYLGITTSTPELAIGDERAAIDELAAIADGVLADIYPLYTAHDKETLQVASAPRSYTRKSLGIARPQVVLPVFPGTNSELDTARAFRRNGADVSESLILNRNHADIEQSLQALEKRIGASQILVLAGGFSAGDEPDGSGKFMANVLANPRIRDAILGLLARDGLVLGICNGFQALVKSGLLPYGDFRTPQAGDATLTHNVIARHVAHVASTVIANNHSPWLADFRVGDIHDVDFSHGEGRFVASRAVLDTLVANGQVATQYCDPQSGTPSMEPRYNPNGSMLAIEGLMSPCGRIFGKMGHSERHLVGGKRNYPDFRTQNIFASAINALR